MNKIIPFLVCFFMSQLAVDAQKINYSVNHKNGSFVPAKGNILKSKRSSSYLLFGDKYYVMIQFNSLPSEIMKGKLKEKGVILSGYLPNNTFYASMPIAEKNLSLEKFNIRAIFGLNHELKIDQRLLIPEKTAAWAIVGEKLSVNIKYTEGADADAIRALFAQKTGIEIVKFSEKNAFIEARISKSFVTALAGESYIQWIEPIHPPLTADNLPGKTSHGSSYIGNINNRNLTGKNIKVGEWDGGYVGSHIDFGNRKIVVDSNIYSDHATHVAGTICGAGIKLPYVTGMAPQAILYSSDFYDDIQAEMDTVSARHQIDITSNSYGYSPSSDPCPKGSYDGESQRIDALVQKYPGLLHVFAAGNSQSQCSSGYRTIASGFNSSKNILTVGACDYKGAMSSFSSWGPTVDGRLKPEICGVGVSVISTIDRDNFANSNGTSMATPGVSGTCAQLYELYEKNNNNKPDAATIRAVVCNTASDAGNSHADYQYGFGNINAAKAAEVIDSNWFLTDTVSSGISHNYSLNVASNVKELKIMLGWTDMEGSGSASSVLVNDLDLFIITPANDTIYPWILDPANPSAGAIRGIDTVNNLEQVTIDNPTSGTYSLYVNGQSVPYGPQKYTLTWLSQQPELLLTYPNGSENFKPGDVETVRWYSKGITGTYTLDYSIDSGVTWTNITSGLTTNYYNWTVPSVATGKALIKIYVNGYTDSSDRVFTIYETIASLSAKACSDAVQLNWSAVSGADTYKIYRLDNSNYSWTYINLVSAATTTYIDASLNNGEKYYYTVAALDQYGVEGRKSQSVSVTPQLQISGMINNSGSLQFFCGDTMTLTGAPGGSYLWSSGDTSQSIVVTQPGSYSVAVTYASGCIANSAPMVIVNPFYIYADTTIFCGTNSIAHLHAHTPRYNTTRFTEIVQNKSGSGASSSYPSWITGSSANADYLELSNMGDDTLSLSGLRIEVWTNTGIIDSFSWPSYATLAPTATTVLHLGNSATNDSTHLFFNTGTTDDKLGSGSLAGYILKDSRGRLLDAVAVNGYKFPSASGISEEWWYGDLPAPFMQGYAGVRLDNEDNNRGTEWKLSTASKPIDLSTYNASLITIESASINWTDGNTFNQQGIDVDLVVTSSMNLTATMSTQSCADSKNIALTIITPTLPVVHDSAQCGPGIPLCSVFATGTISWYSDSVGGTLLQASGSTYQDSISVSTDFWVTNTQNGCESQRVKISAIVGSSQTVTIVNMSGTVCEGEYVILNAFSISNSYQYRWSASAAGNLITSQGDTVSAFPTSDAIYTVIGQDMQNGCADTADFNLYLYAKPSIDINCLKTSFCPGDSAELFVDTAVSGDWKSNYLVIEYDATQGTSGLSNVAKVYMHSGLVDTTINGNSWRKTVGNYGQDDGIGLMTALGNNSWKITIDLINYYGVTADSSLKYIGLTFRNEDGSQSGKDNNNEEIFINLQNGALVSSFAGVKAAYEHNYQWYHNGNFIASGKSVVASAGGEYFCADQGIGCSHFSDSIYITVNPAPAGGNLQTSQDSICLGDSVTIEVKNNAGNADWQYYDGSAWQNLNLSGQAITLTPSADIWVRALSTVQCGQALSDSMMIFIKALPSHGSLTLSRDSICSPDTVSFTWSGSSSVQDWIFNGTSLQTTGNSINFQVPNSGYMTAVVGLVNGCANIFDSTYIFAYSKPYAGTIKSNLAFVCSADSFLLTVDSAANGSVSFEYFDTYNTAQFISIAASAGLTSYKTIGQGNNTWAAASYRVKVQSVQCGDDYSDTVTVAIGESNDPGSVSASMDTICPYDQVTLSYTAKGSQPWFNQNPSDWLYQDTAAQWTSLNDSSIAIQVSPGIQTIYRAAFYKSCDTDFVDYTLYIKPHAIRGTIAANKDTLCIGDTVILSSSQHAGTVVWQQLINGIFNDIDTGASISYVPAISNYYRAKYELGMCDSLFSDSIYIYINQKPLGGVAGLDKSSYCSGDSATFSLSNYAGNVMWQVYDSTAAIWVDMNISQDTFIINAVSQAARYRAQVSNGICSPEYSNDLILNIGAQPTAGVITASNDSVCPGIAILLKTSGYQGTPTWQYYDSLSSVWVNSGNADTLAIAISKSTVYRVSMLSGSCGPVFSNSYTVNIRKGPQFGNLTASSNNVCVGSIVQLNLSAPLVGTITWQEYNSGTAQWLNKTGSMNPFVVYPYDSSRYRAVVTNNGCKAQSNEILITTKASPNSNITAAGSTTICDGESVTLNAVNVSGNKYQWLKDSVAISGQQGTSYNASQSGVYQVIITNNVGCSATSGKITVNVLSAPATPVITRSGNQLDAGVSGLIYQWYKSGIPISGASSQQYVLTGGGIYTVKVTSTNGCFALSQPYNNTGISANPTDQKNIYIYPNPSTGLFTLETELKVSQIQILDINGKLIWKQSEGRFQFDLSNQADGIYILQFESAGQLYHLRLIKE